MTFIDRMNDCMTVFGYICLLSIIGFFSWLTVSAIKQDRTDNRKAAEFAAAEKRQADAWRETLNSQALTRLMPLPDLETPSYADVADRWPTGGGHL